MPVPMPQLRYVDLLHKLTAASGPIKIYNNTEMYYSGNGTIGLCLHGNHIATLYDNNVVAIRTTGWVTTTTMHRLRGVIGHNWYACIERGVPMVKPQADKAPYLAIPDHDWLMLTLYGKRYKNVSNEDFNVFDNSQHGD